MQSNSKLEYGTHWFKEISMGGELLIETLYDKELRSKQKEIEMSMQATMNKFGVTLAGQSSDQWSLGVTNVESSFFWRGGNVLGKSSNLGVCIAIEYNLSENWVDNLEDAPAEFPRRIILISSLLQDTAKKANLEVAIKVYLEAAAEDSKLPLIPNLTKSQFFGGPG